MNTPESLTNYQKSFLKDLYKKKSPITKRELQSQPEKYNLSEIYSLIDANSNLIRIRGKNTFNESVEITCEGRAMVEFINAQENDKAYQQDIDIRSLEIAHRANEKSDKSNRIAIIAAVLAAIAIIADIILALFT